MTATNNNNNSNHPSSNDDAFSNVMTALARDMPLMMHGSGDVVPSDVNSDSVMLLSELTALYIANLVDAAVDAHNLLSEGAPPNTLDHNRSPPSPVVHSRQPFPPQPPASSSSGAATTTDDKDKKDNKSNNNTKSTTNTTNKRKESRRERRIRSQEDYWDEPLPEPKIRKKNTGTTAATTTTTSLRTNKKKKKDDNKPQQHVHIDEWIGAAGVDLWENRSRAAHVRNPWAIGVQSFIFPICHDPVLYGRVIELQSARRSIAPVLEDPVLMELVRTEGPKQQRRHAADKNKDPNKNAGANNAAGNKDVDDPTAPASDEEEEDEAEDNNENNNNNNAMEEDGTGCTWPGLADLLPVYRVEDLLED